jgi:hypothetical protein
MRSLFVWLEYIYVYGYAGKIIRAPSGVMHGKSSPVFYDEELGKALFDGLPKYRLLKMYRFICFYFSLFSCLLLIFDSSSFIALYVSFFFLSFLFIIFTFLCFSFFIVFPPSFLLSFLFSLLTFVFVSVFRPLWVSYITYPTCLRLKGCCCHVYWQLLLLSIFLVIFFYDSKASK